MTSTKELILGLDPGSRRTGYGVIAVQGDRVKHVEHGVIELKESWTFSERLACLHEELQKLFGRFPVARAVVEKIFFGKNADSAFKLGHARGVCLLVAAQNRVAISEYAARYVKKAITGSGAASKEHVQTMIFRLLELQPKELKFDASDALSLAVTYARVHETETRMRRLLEENP